METKLNSKGKRFFAPAIAAGLMLAMAFTLNACGGDGSGGGDEAPASSSSGNGSPSSSSSGGGSPSSSSQPSHEHAWGEWSVTTDPTCEAAGTKTRTCTGNNSHTETEEIAKLDWEWTVTTPATPTTVGEETKTCPGNASPPSGTRPLLPKCSGVGYDPRDGKFQDCRDSKFYKYVDINGQVWTAENLNYKADGSKCGNVSTGTLTDNATDCDKYGRLYDWNTAMDGAASSTAEPSGVQGVCPSGWHLPSSAEWQTLIDFAGGDETAGTKLKAESGWNTGSGYIPGTDDHGFSALPGGDGYSNGFFGSASNGGNWWSASEYDYNSDRAYYLTMFYSSEVAGRDSNDKGIFFSVRCVRD